jgi:hypothetical protein
MHSKLKLLASVGAVTATVGGVALAAASPSVSTGSASSIKSSSATLNGTVNPNGASTSFEFEFGLTTAYGATTSPKSAGSGTVAKAISHGISHLIPGTTYHYRLLAQNKSGGTTGSDRKFTTAGHPPPLLATGGVQVGATSAVVLGVVNPNKVTTSYYFQYGLSTAYTARTATATVPAGSVPVVVAQTLAPLAPDTVIHYRLVAQHAGSVLEAGADASFLTFPIPRIAVRVRANTTPHRDRKAPFTFNTFGSVSPPSHIGATLGCAQNAIVRFFFGKREVAATVMPVQPNCTFAGQTTIPRLPGHGKRHRTVTLKVQVRARGNGYLATSDAGKETVTLGG